MIDCGVCVLHADPAAQHRYEIARAPLWILRHHPDPAPLPGWLLLDARRHMAGPIAFTAEEAAAWGGALQQASQLVQTLTGCDRVYTIAFGEGAPHLHLHLIPRSGLDDTTEAWRVADLYRAVANSDLAPADPSAVKTMVERARAIHLASHP